MMPELSTRHDIVIGKAQKMNWIKDRSIHLVVTSPPYPMIEMWDDILSNQHSAIRKALRTNQGQTAFELMHLELDKVWSEIDRVLVPGGFVCINIGDAARTIDKEFALFPNHSRIIQAFQSLGFSNLPNIIWRKQTNAPNKFMGSGMLPAGAYVTLEHEWILIFRKGSKRVFVGEAEKQLRKESAFFWEERNSWFSDLWDLKGVRQKMDGSPSRSRSAAFPFEIPYRLINMYSLKGDTVLDPFLGTGTTTVSALVTQRNSIGIEIDPLLVKVLTEGFEITDVKLLNQLTLDRIEQHRSFIDQRTKDQTKMDLKHFNNNLNLPVMTLQETEMILSFIKQIDRVSTNTFVASFNSSHQNARSCANPEITELPG